MGSTHRDDHRLRHALGDRAVGAVRYTVAVSRSRLAVLSFFAAVAAAALAGERTQAAPQALDDRLAAALQAPGIDMRKTSAVAVDVRSGTTVFAHNEQASLLPASAEKLPVSLAALEVLGPRFRFRTEVVGVGARRGDVWRGSIWLVGYGDPTLAVSDLDRLARSFAATGIRRIVGRVFGDDSRYDARRDVIGWKSSYLGFESRPISALSVARIPLTNPNGSAIAAARAYVDALERRGINVTGRAGARRVPAGGHSIAFDLSEPLSLLLRRVNGDSDNYAAELLLKELGATAAEQGSSAAGARVVRRTLRELGVPLTGVRLADGSGLSRFDRLTAKALVAMLRVGADDPAIRRAFVSSLAVAGVSGTLERRLATRPTYGRVRAKTGTTQRASALAGFVGGRYVFAILQNGAPVPYWTAREAQDRFVTILARN